MDTRSKTLFKTKALAQFHDAVARFVLTKPGRTPKEADPRAPSAWRLVQGIGAIGTIGGPDLAVSGPGPRGAPHVCHLRAEQLVASAASIGLVGALGAARVVTGWLVELLSRQANGQMTAVLSHNSIVEGPDGHWMCPNSPVGTNFEFFEDATRGFNADLNWNMLVVSNRANSKIGAFTPAWYTQVGALKLLSTDQRHAHWVRFLDQSPFDFVRAMGCDPHAFVDLAFMSDLNRVLEATPELVGWRPFASSVKEQAAVLQDLEQAWLISRDPQSLEELENVHKLVPEKSS